MDLYDLPMPSIVIAIFIVVMLIVVAVANSREKAREAKYLTIEVKLASRKIWRSFNAEDAFLGISLAQVLEARKLFVHEYPKNKLRIRWSYSTPSGRDHYSNEIVYTASEYLLERLNRAESILKGGNEKIEALNSLYAEALEKGREIEDGTPKIYGYRIRGSKKYEDLVKVGYASKNAHRRIAQQFNTAVRLEVDPEILFILPALSVSGDTFTARPVHRILKDWGISNPEGEWFHCNSQVAKNAVMAIQQRSGISSPQS